MKKRIMTLVLALALTVVGLAGQTTLAQAADETKSQYDWVATYDGSDTIKTTKDGKVESEKIKKKLEAVLPGDTIKLKIGYENKDKNDADFYLSTDITNYLEDTKKASGGGYTYKISYKTPANSDRVDVYSNDMVGGDETGLSQVDTGANTFFKIGTLKKDQVGDVQIEITLDGNTQDNSYMATLAALDIKFGVPKRTVNVVEQQGKSESVVTVVPGGTEVIAITDPDTPLAVNNNNPQTGDPIIPMVACTAGLVVGIMFILAYFIISKKQREEVA